MLKPYFHSLLSPKTTKSAHYLVWFECHVFPHYPAWFICITNRDCFGGEPSPRPVVLFRAARQWPPGSVEPHPPPPVPGLDKLTRPKTGLSHPRLVFLGDILGRVFPIGQRVALTYQPAVQVRAVCGVANTERPQVAVPALNRAGDRVRPDPRPERLSGVIPTRVAPLACRQDCADSGASIP